jgi:hypothetical protein
MRIVLFKISWWNVKQLVIGLFSWGKVCHAALLFKDETRLYDASESRGTVDWNKELKEFGRQPVIIYEVPEDGTDAKKYALDKKGTKYDWKGIMGWTPFFGSNDPQTVYCFELVLQTLLLGLPTINGYAIGHLAPDLMDKLFKKPIDSDDIFILMERARLTPIYQGQARNFIEG